MPERPRAFEGEGLGNFFKKKGMVAHGGAQGAGPIAAPPRAAAANGAALGVELERLDDNPFQPRGTMDEGALEELAAGIARNGLLQAITVRRVADRFQIIAGHRRVAAYRLLRERASDAEKAKYAAIAAQEKLDVTDEQMAVYALIENLQRVDLDFVEAATGLARYQEAEQLSAHELAERTGLEIRRVQRLLQLHSAPTVVKEGVSKGLLVPVLGEGGKAVITPSGKERQERRKLDLLGAIEVERVYRHWAKDDEKRAGARTEALVRRALTDGWSFRKLREHCQAATAGRAPRAVADAPEGIELQRPALFDDTPHRLVIFKDRLTGASSEQRVALAKVLSAFVKELG